MSDAIARFTGEYRFLSNFFPCTIVYDGMSFRSVEHAYQAAKTADRKERRIIQVQPKPGDAKRAGRRLKGIRLDWDKVKVGIMYDLVRKKFVGTSLEPLLDATGDRNLVEGNTWHDNFWGVCSCGQCPETPMNWLGKILMDVRADVRERV